MSEPQMKRLLKDMEHGDQDNREMAATDLCTEIEKGQKLTAALEKSICRAYITQLSDSSLNVRGNAVKCISRIGSRISETQFGEITNKLTECVVKGTEEFRDIYATCLKTLISEADETFGKTLCNCLLPPLIHGTEHKLDAVREQCTEITNEILKRFNSVLAVNPAFLKEDKLMHNLISSLIVTE
jgi:cullin-associated NEDD8-dissociated protein 1